MAMTLNERILAFSRVGNFLNQFKTTGYKPISKNPEEDKFFIKFKNKIQTAHHHNGWFKEDNVLFSIEQWSQALQKENLEAWLSSYSFDTITARTIGVIMAGNIPLVGFHDFLSVLISGHSILIRQSSNDTQLLPVIAEYLTYLEPKFMDRIKFTSDKLTNYDAIIATGSNNTARYFEHYFGNKPNIIRKNRNSIAILTGDETEEQLTALGEDVFRYYGLGCRSVSKIMVPEGYNFEMLFKAMYSYSEIMNSAKYANNYDYNKAVYLMSNFKLFENGFLMLKEDPSYSSPIATLFYETYTSKEKLIKKLEVDAAQIQCIVNDHFHKENIPFGQTQCPKLNDYADGIDIIKFLIQIT